MSKTKYIKTVKKPVKEVIDTSKEVKEDDDHYAYNDTNAEAGVDNDFSVSETDMDPVGVFRKHKRNVVKLVRKPKKVRRCKCN